MSNFCYGFNSALCHLHIELLRLEMYTLVSTFPLDPGNVLTVQLLPATPLRPMAWRRPGFGRIQATARLAAGTSDCRKRRASGLAQALLFCEIVDDGVGSLFG